MSSFRGYGALCQIFVIDIFVHAQTIDPVSASIGDIVGNFTELCEDFENLPNTLCSKLTEGVKKEMDKLCDKAVTTICELIPFPFTLVISESTCEDLLKGTICELDDDLIDYVKDKCIDELSFIEPHCDDDGEEIDLCEHVPTTAGGICTFIVDEACDELPVVLSPFSYICQDIFTDIC